MPREKKSKYAYSDMYSPYLYRKFLAYNGPIATKRLDISKEVDKYKTIENNVLSNFAKGLGLKNGDEVISVFNKVIAETTPTLSTLSEQIGRLHGETFDVKREVISSAMNKYIDGSSEEYDKLNNNQRKTIEQAKKTINSSLEDLNKSPRWNVMVGNSWESFFAASVMKELSKELPAQKVYEKIVNNFTGSDVVIKNNKVDIRQLPDIILKLNTPKISEFDDMPISIKAKPFGKDYYYLLGTKAAGKQLDGILKGLGKDNLAKAIKEAIVNQTTWSTSGYYNEVKNIWAKGKEKMPSNIDAEGKNPRAIEQLDINGTIAKLQPATIALENAILLDLVTGFGTKNLFTVITSAKGKSGVLRTSDILKNIATSNFKDRKVTITAKNKKTFATEATTLLKQNNKEDVENYKLWSAKTKARAEAMVSKISIYVTVNYGTLIK